MIWLGRRCVGVNIPGGGGGDAWKELDEANLLKGLVFRPGDLNYQGQEIDATFPTYAVRSDLVTIPEGFAQEWIVICIHKGVESCNLNGYVHAYRENGRFVSRKEIEEFGDGLWSSDFTTVYSLGKVWPSTYNNEAAFRIVLATWECKEFDALMVPAQLFYKHFGDSGIMTTVYKGAVK